MEGMIGGIFGAAGSIGGALIAADAQKYSANMNWSIALMNYYARERERTQARMEASRVEAKQDLGSTDIQGTRTRFVPGQGWVVEPTAQKKALMAREDAERMAQLGVDAQIKRDTLQANQIQQIKERDRASALFDQMRKQHSPTVSELKDLIYGETTKGINRGYDDTLQIGARQALRTGRDPGPIFADIATARARELGNASGSALSQAMQLAPQIEDQDTKAKANLYNLFATRASAMPDVSFSPQPLSNEGLQLAVRGDRSDAGLKAAMMEGGRLPFVPPLYGTANAVGAIGAAGQGLMRNLSGVRFNEDYGGGSLYDEMKRRYGGNEGSFTNVP